VHHPATHDARCAGAITEVSDTETICELTEPAPTYSAFGIAVYPAWTQSSLGAWDGINVTLYDRPTTLVATAIDGAYHAGFVAWMQQNFGPYPYGAELRILTAPTYWNGFEHPGNIILDDGVARRPRPLYWNETAHVLDHEIVHMWAGNQTTLAGTYDFVWKEAMSEYLTFVYEHETFAPNGLRSAASWKGAAQGAEYFPVPGDQPALFDYYADVYGAGPMVLFRQLEVMTSRQQVLDAIRMVLGTRRTLSVTELVAALQQTTGLELDAYAAAWIFGSGRPSWPRIALTFTPGAGTSMLAIDTTTPVVPGQGCKFDVALHGANMSDVRTIAVDTFTGGPDQTLQLPTPPFAVTNVVLDPENVCLVYDASITPRLTRVNPWLSAPP
jgi:aminopeptidase N